MYLIALVCALLLQSESPISPTSLGRLVGGIIGVVVVLLVVWFLRREN